jgi:very-short-patch-repair endonuclease
MVDAIAGIARTYRLTAEKHLPPLTEQSRGCRFVFANCDSPIEQIFCLSLFQVADVWAIPAEFVECLPLYRSPTRRIIAFSQFPIRQYRADFLLVALSPEQSLAALVVECDGKDFHSSPDAIARDMARERDLRDWGYQVVRHSGAEIYDNPAEVVGKTLENLRAHGWSRSDAASVNNFDIRRAVAALSIGDMGYRAPTLKPVGQSIANVLASVEGERGGGPSRGLGDGPSLGK